MRQIQKQASPEPLQVQKIRSNSSVIIQVEPCFQQQQKQKEQYQQQRYRWVIVILVSIAFAINNLANNAIIPIASKVQLVYDLSPTYANLPIQISFLINPIMNFTAGHFIDSKGLGISFRIGSVMYAIGMFCFCLINYGYHFVLIGSILIALGQPLVMNSPAKIATFWFLKDNRSLATGIISAINILTLGIGLVFPAIFVKEQSKGQQAKQQIFSLYSKYFIATIINCVLIMIFMREKPNKLPSAGAQQQKTHISKTFQIIKSDRNLWRFFIAAMLLYGTFLSFGSTSNMLFKPYGFDDPQIAIFGICLLVSGILGSVAYTFYIKKTVMYKRAIVVACFSAVFFIFTNALLMNLVSQQRALISIMILGMGFNLIPMVPISYDLGCQLTFPVGQAQVVGILTGGSMLYTVVLTLTISSVVGFGTTQQSAINMAIYICLFLAGAILYSTVDINLKRRKMENQREQRRTQNASSLLTNDLNQTIEDSAAPKHVNFLRTQKISLLKNQNQPAEQLFALQPESFIKSDIQPSTQSSSQPFDSLQDKIQQGQSNYNFGFKKQNKSQNILVHEAIGDQIDQNDN